MSAYMLCFIKIYIAGRWKKIWIMHYVKSVQIRSFFWSVFSRIRTEYGEILHISLYSVQMRENTDQNNSKYGHFLRSASLMDQYFYTNPQGNMRLLYQNLSDTIITDFIWSYERHIQIPDIHLRWIFLWH